MPPMLHAANVYNKICIVQINTLISHKTTCLIWCRSHLCCKNSSDLSRHGLCKTSKDVLWYLMPRHQSCSNPFKSCKLWGGTSMEQTCSSSTSHRRLTSGCWMNGFNFLWCSFNHFWTIIAAFLSALSCRREFHCLNVPYSVKICLLLCQNNIHMNPRTQYFQAGHY